MKTYNVGYKYNYPGAKHEYVFKIKAISEKDAFRRVSEILDHRIYKVTSTLTSL